MSYKLQEQPDKEGTYRNTNNTFTPVVTLKDEYGGVSHIIIDDHCYVLLNGSYDRKWMPTNHWFSEAVEALKTLPLPK